MRIAGNRHQRWAGDGAAMVAAIASGGLVATLFGLALAIEHLAGLVQYPFGMFPH
jgi:hypothetical protein